MCIRDRGCTLRGGINLIKWGITEQTVYDEVVEGVNNYIWIQNVRFLLHITFR